MKSIVLFAAILTSATAAYANNPCTSEPVVGDNGDPSNAQCTPGYSLTDISDAAAAESRRANDLTRVLSEQCTSTATATLCSIFWTDGVSKFNSACAWGSLTDWVLDCWTDRVGPYTP